MWDDEIITNLFDQLDTKEILSIPTRQGIEDTVAWHFDKGVFSVKTCYQLGVRLHDHALCEDASSSARPEE